SSLHFTCPATLQIHKPGPAPGSPDLAIVKTGVTSALPGQIITYTLRFTNLPTAISIATGVQVSDILPGAVTFVAGSATGYTNIVVGNTITWDIGDMAIGAIGTVTYQVKVNTNAVAGSTFAN